MLDPYEYSIIIKKVVIDGKRLFGATVQELPDVIEYGNTYQETYELAIDTITTAAQMCAEANIPFPEPIKHKELCYA